MPDFVTVFEITQRSNGVWDDALFRLIIGLAVLAIGLRAVFFKWGTMDGKSWVFAVFMTLWAVGWIGLHNFPRMFGHTNELLKAYRDGQYRVTEGEVQVLHRQPYAGHSKGDVVVVNGEKFEVDYFYATPAYAKTLSHGGALASGAYARIYHHNGEIVRVDIRK